MLKRFIHYYKPHWRLLVLDMIAALLISLSGIFYPILTRNMLNDYIPNQEFRLIIYSGIALFVIYFLRYLFRYFVQYYGHMIGTYMQAAMRRDLFAHLQRLPFSFYDEHETGKIMSRMVNDLMDISELAHHGPENIFISSFMLIWSLFYLGFINWILTAIIFACVPILFFFSLFMRKRMRSAFMETRKNIAEINATLENSISGIRVTKAFTNSDYEQEKFQINNERLVGARRKAYKAMAQFHSGTSFITDVFNVVVLIAGGIFTYKQYIDYGDLVAFMLCVNLFINPINTLVSFMEQFQNGATGFKRFIELIDEKIESENPNAKAIDKVMGEISFNDVTFSYTEGNEVLGNVSLKLLPGQKVALVGPSGGGKTTICHLIPNFYQIQTGSITIDDIDINDIQFASLRKNIGIVQQDVFLFNGTIMENIMYGNLSASTDDAINAAKKARIHDYVMTLPEGYDTNIGERGIKLSGGQKQRLSIARVFLKDPQILILDEATSALDNTTEILIQQALDELCVGRTTLVVAHRLSTIKNADYIIVIDEGKIKEQGSHDELLKKGGMYKHLYELQFRSQDQLTVIE